MAKNKVIEANIADLIPDDKNFNLGSEYGKGLLDKSMQKFGAGRSVLIDKNNRLIAGNKASESFGELGNEKVLIVETTGDTLVAVKRTDIDLDTAEGREMAMADNATAKADLVWDNETIGEVCSELGINAGEWGVKVEESVSADDYGEDFNLPDGDKPATNQITFYFSAEQKSFVQDMLGQVVVTEDDKLGNENKNGNALFAIVKQWAELRTL